MHQIRFRLGLRIWEGSEREVEGREREGPQISVEPGPLKALLRHCSICLSISCHRFSRMALTSLLNAVNNGQSQSTRFSTRKSKRLDLCLICQSTRGSCSSRRIWYRRRNIEDARCVMGTQTTRQVPAAEDDVIISDEANITASKKHIWLFIQTICFTARSFKCVAVTQTDTQLPAISKAAVRVQFVFV